MDADLPVFTCLTYVDTQMSGKQTKENLVLSRIECYYSSMLMHCLRA